MKTLNEYLLEEFDDVFTSLAKEGKVSDKVEPKVLKAIYKEFLKFKEGDDTGKDVATVLNSIINNRLYI